MNRNEAIEIIKDIAGPLGPFQSVESMEDLMKLRTDKYNLININSIDTLIDIILNPPSEEERGHISSEDFELELVEMLTSVGLSDVTSFLKKVKELLYLKQTRSIIIDVLGNLRHEESILLLELLLQENLSDNEVVHLANAVYENGGFKANEILKKMKYSNGSQEVLREIDICITNLGLDNK